MTFSIRHRLLWLLLVCLVGLSFGASIVTYFQARADINDLLDYEMRQMVLMLGTHISAHPELSEEPLLRADHDYVVQVWNQRKELLISSRPGRGPDRLLTLGFSQSMGPNGEWRTFAEASGEYSLQIAQPLTHRRELAAGIAVKAMLPVAVIIPLGGFVIWLLVAYGLKPLRIIAKEVETRDPNSLEPIAVAAPLPAEVAPLVSALNGLLKKLDHALCLEKQFIADASHELRTPVSALSLSVDLLEIATAPAEKAEATREVKRSVERMKRLVHQILTMARLDPDFAEAVGVINLSEFIDEIKAEFSGIAAAKSIIFTVRSGGPARVKGDIVSLRALIGNLVDNALRHTPSGGTVTIELDDQNGAPIVRVTDSGPGIPDKVRSRLFTRFARGGSVGDGDGVGLGLAIAKRAAERLGAQLRLQNNPGGKGLAAIIELFQGRISTPKPTCTGRI